MSRTAATAPTMLDVPSVAYCATLGVVAGLLALHGLTIGTPDAAGPLTLTCERVRLRVDPNVATRAELMLLPRIGPTIAGHIIEYRESVRPQSAFRCPEDLRHVHRIGPVTVETLRPFLRFPSDRVAVRAEVGSP